MKDKTLRRCGYKTTKMRENVMLLVTSLWKVPGMVTVLDKALSEKEIIKEVDDILLDYLINNSSDALIETVLDMYPDEVREKLRG